MPSSKKKRGGKGKGSAERQRALAIRAERKLPIEALPPFPGPETYEQEIERILSYKYVSTDIKSKNVTPYSLTRDGDGIRITELSHDMKVMEADTISIKKGGRMPFKFVPDYDRNTATFPVAKEVLSALGGVDMARRVKKRIGDVPTEKLDVFRKFVAGGEGLEIKCDALVDSKLGLYSIGVEVVGEDEAFLFSAGRGYDNMSFVGTFGSKCLEKYQKELAFFLMYESMLRVSAGTAEIEEGIDVNEAVHAISGVLGRLITEKKKWKDLIGLHSFLLERAVECKSSLNTSTSIECELGEALEACGFFSHAALLYGESGKHLYLAEHPKAATVLRNAGIAWKRHGDFEQAESFYALALQSMRFVYDHEDYRECVFGILKSLFLIYYDAEKNIAPLKLFVTLRALIMAAGEEVAVNRGFDDNGFPPLREAYHGASPEQMCRVIQSIVTKSTSVKDLRAAILSCANPGTRHVEYSKHVGEKNHKEHAQNFLKDSRGQLQKTGKSSGFLVACSACGDVKNEKAFKTCSACNNEYYCDEECQKTHWPEHKAECKTNRKKKAAKK